MSMVNYWFVLAVAGAILWGLHYPLVEKSLDTYSPLTLMFVISISFALVIPLIHQTLLIELKQIWASDLKTKLILVGVIITEFLAIYLVMKAIMIGNATYVSLVEITYPLFVLLFSAILFKENHFTPPVMIGAALVFIGIGIIVYYGNPHSNEESAEPTNTPAVQTENG